MQIWNDPRASTRLRKWLYLLIAVCLLVSLGKFVLQASLFPVKQIQINGKLKHISQDQLQFVAQNKVIGDTLTLDLNQVKNSFEELSWIKEAEAKRHWPDTLEITIVEKKAIARWKEGGLVDSDGNWFEANTDEELPIFDGPKGSESQMKLMYEELTKTLQPEQLKVKALYLTDRNAWQVRLDNDILLKLGTDDALKRVDMLKTVWRKYLEAQASDIEYIDLRYSNGFALKMRSEPDKPVLG
ncbi:cell division protein FtsQ/DivIB [Neisseria sp. Ec49-e6-T10]|uniref:cell division protein FtsQ/DivIB n=1 Tax=Neisseria sp. Ec49-e6-T10 TaxID=3140744 RepID=UPI003EC0C656